MNYYVNYAKASLATIAHLAYLVESYPTISMVYPASGYNAKDYSIFIVGTDFRDGTTVSMTQGATTKKATITSLTPTKIGCILPTSGLASGFYNMTVTNSDESSSTKTYAYALLTSETAPTISSVSPPNGHNSINNDVIITGTNFRNCAAVVMKKDTSRYSASILNLNSTTILCTLPTNGITAGIYDIYISNRDGTNTTKSNAFTVYT
jgi:hypothetical protein